jgi:stage II sporulation protein D
MRQLLIVALLLQVPGARAQDEPIVRIGLDQNASMVTLRSASPFSVLQHQTRSATFTTALALGSDTTTGAVKKSTLQRRVIVELEDDVLLVMSPGTKARIEPSGASIAIGGRTYRGAVEVFGNTRNTLTVVNELPLEQYLLGVVPNELSPTTFGQVEALKAQAVAARTYIQRNRGQYRNEGYDICATDACQVYLGAGTEDASASQAVIDTRGVIATYDDKPINALYSSTCGGRTESAENVFGEKVPYLVSTSCEYQHPEPLPFSSSRSFMDWRTAVLAVARVANFSDAQRFMSLPDRGEPPSTEPAALAQFIRQAFYPSVRTMSDLSFVTEQGILPPAGSLPTEELLFRLIDKKGAFEWQQGILVSWDGQRIKLLVGGQPREFSLGRDAPIYQRIGDERLPLRQGSWIGGELMDFRVEGDTIQMLVYRINFANPAADRYSRLAVWQVHKSRQELDAAFKALNIGEFTDLRIVDRGPSERPVNTDVIGSRGRQTVRALRLRTLLGLRDSLFSFDIERNASGAVLGMMLYGRGWGHGVGMCQVGAYGMALDGASYEAILKKYYRGIELKKLY